MIDFSQRPGNTECFHFLRSYIEKVPDGDILEILQSQLDSIPRFIRAIAQEQFEVVHPPYSWSVRVVIEHCADAERVWGYRILRFATGEVTELPGWDENYFAACGYAREVLPAVLADEFMHARASNLLLLRRLQESAWDRIGIASSTPASVRALAWGMAGHWLHHEAILRQRLQ